MAAVAEKAIGSEDQFMRHQMPPPADGAEAEYQSEVRELVDLLSKLNPAAKEFVPSSNPAPAARLSAVTPFFMASGGFYSNGLLCNLDGGMDSISDGSSNNQPNRRRRYGHNQGLRRMNDRLWKAEREESVKRTVYISDVDRHVTEEKLAEIFATCGQVVDCRICGDPHSVMRFAFIEFSDEDGARTALNLGGTMLGYYPVKVLPSKTAIMPVNPKLLPRSEDEKEMVIRTVYCTNIDKKVTQPQVKAFFEQSCGEVSQLSSNWNLLWLTVQSSSYQCFYLQVSRLRLLGDNIHSTRIAFVEFAQAESAISALNCSGVALGGLPIRVSPSKTPVRPRST
ncbi:polyadenylate-binding protein-interacting protein 9-like isoform X1 [Musa acuminata AAA Group]|uniref:polyadenylate-binding protein-interacting protein 9-like isoform X1 n=1 Tax=Musa acuminata AAA Group TaxID=214697 RepID=UPI0031DB16AD